MIFVLGIAFLVALLSFVVSSSVSVLVGSLFSVIVCVIVSVLSGKRDRIVSVKVCLTVFSFYSLLALVHYCDVTFFNHYTFTDEYDSFLPWVERKLKADSLSSLWDECFMCERYWGYIFYTALWGFIANTFFDGYNTLLFFQSSVLVGSLSSIFLYRMLRLYWKSRTAKKWTYLYMLCSPIVLFSFVMLRDVHVAFLYMMGLYIVYKNSKLLPGLISLLIIDLILFTFRIEQGIFFCSFILYFIYNKSNKKWYVILPFLAVVLIGVYGYVSSGISYMIEVSNNIAQVTMDSNANSSGISKMILSLPTPLKEILSAAYSQVTPFPSWTALSKASNIYNVIISIIYIVFEFFWFFVVYAVIYSLTNERVRRQILKQHGWLILLYILLLIGCSGEAASIRRVFCIYPILYVVFVSVCNDYGSNIQYNKIRNSFIILFMMLNIAYSFVKI